MTLVEALEIIKVSRFEIFVYSKGHVAEGRGINENLIVIYEIECDDEGRIPLFPFSKFSKSEVVEIIPVFSDKCIIVAEI